MLYGQDRNQLRQMFLDAWRKFQAQQPMEALERLIAGVVAEHPEYHGLLAATDQALARDFMPELGESNPFLHMALHIAIREQLSVDRPPGVVARHTQLLHKHTDAHAVQHLMIECLAGALWEAQRSNRAPDEAAYLECLRKLG